MNKGFSKKYQKAAQAGQLPLITPASSWRRADTLPDLRGHKIIAADLETKDDGLANGKGPGWCFPGMGYICGAVLAVEGLSVYAPVRHPDSDNFDEDAVRRWWGDHMRCEAQIIFQNAPYDVGWGKTCWNVDPPEVMEDTMGMANIIDENRYTYNLDDLCKWVGIPGKDEKLLREAAACFGIADVKAGIHKLPARYAGPYAEQDGTSTLGLFHKLKARLEEQSLWDAYRLEADLVPLIVAMRRRGIRIDTKRAEEVKDQLNGRRDEILRELSDKIPQGRAVDIKDVRSYSWLCRMFDDHKIPVPKLESGKYSFESDWMSRREHWLPRLIAEAREYDESANKFVGNYIQNFVSRGRIHAEIHQYKDDEGGTKTSRLAYSKPPLQQMPSRNEVIATLIRGLFLPEHGEIWGSLDYSQQEYRLIVHFAYLCQMVGAEAAVKIYLNNPDADFHQIVVDLTGLTRNSAKDANFAKAYRAGVPKFASMIDKSEAEAAAIYKTYDEKLPFVSRLAEHCDSRAQSRGFLKLIDGARAHFDSYEPRWIDRAKFAQGLRDGMPMGPCSFVEAKRRTEDKKHPWYRERLRRADTYKSMNKLIQGSAARQTKMAMRGCWREGITPLIQMHDELANSFSDPRVARRMGEIMRDVVKLCIPVKVDAEFGVNWGAAAKVKDKDKKIIYGATWDEAIRVRDAA